MAALAKRISSLLMTALMIVGVTASTASAASYENDLLTLMNAERAAVGLKPVSLNADLTDDAAAWSQRMFTAGELSHNPNLGSVTTGWDSLGENVGVGPTIASLHSAFMASAGHRGNILGDYDQVGIAVVAENPTKLWVTVVFMLGLAPAEPAVDTAAPVGEDPVPYAEPRTTTFVTESGSSADSVPTPAIGVVAPVHMVRMVGRPYPI